jgi:RNA polymerase sigma-70 factor (sigma-E family)
LINGLAASPGVASRGPQPRSRSEKPTRDGNLFGHYAREMVVVRSVPAISTVDGDDSSPVSPSVTGFDAYVRAHAQALCRSAFLLTGDRHLAEDLVQAALAKTALRWDHVVSQGDPAPYVRTVIVRTAIAWSRRRWRREVPTSPLPERPTADQGGSVDQGDLHHALLRLPARQRAVLVLRYYEDLSVADTAQAMRCSVGTIKSQTAKGLAHLRAVLADASIPTPQEDRR